MLGLPAHPGRYGTILIVLGVLLAASLALVVWRTIRAAVGGGRAELPVVALLAASLLSAVAAAPFLAWRIVEDIRYTSRLTHPQAERIGGDMQRFDHRLVDRLRALIPPGDTYYVTASPAVPALDHQDLAYWTGYALLPRIRVRDPADARWIVALDTDPRKVGPRISHVRRLTAQGSSEVFYLGRVAS